MRLPVATATAFVAMGERKWGGLENAIGRCVVRPAWRIWPQEMTLRCLAKLRGSTRISAVRLCLLSVLPRLIRPRETKPEEKRTPTGGLLGGVAEMAEKSLHVGVALRLAGTAELLLEDWEELDYLRFYELLGVDGWRGFERTGPNSAAPTRASAASLRVLFVLRDEFGQREMALSCLADLRGSTRTNSAESLPLFVGAERIIPNLLYSLLNSRPRASFRSFCAAFLLKESSLVSWGCKDLRRPH